MRREGTVPCKYWFALFSPPAGGGVRGGAFIIIGLTNRGTLTYVRAGVGMLIYE